ncbi:MAG: S9 family peptidase [bacterium]|nr:S9 family peptidase [bacterium]
MKRSLTLVTVLVLLYCVGPVAAERPITPEDLYNIQRVSDPRVSPDGKWIAVVVAVPDLEENRLDSDIWLVPLDGGEPKRLTHGPKKDDSPRWSPDGKRLAFISDRNGTEDLYLINVRRGEARQLTSSETDLDDPRWSRDGKSILCGSRVVPEGKDKLENWTREELPKCEARTIDRLLFRQWDQWLGDERNHLFLVSVKNGSMEELTPGDFDTPPVSLSSDHDFDLSPDAQELCFVRNDDPDSATSTNHDLYLLDRRTAQMRKLTENPARDSQPHYSPDGRYIAYSAMSTPGYEADRECLVVYDRTTQEHIRLTDSLDRSVREILWHPSSRQLFFTARDQGRLSIFSVDLEGRVKKLAAEGYNRNLTVSPDGGLLVFRRSYNHLPEELFSLSIADGETRQLTSFNADLLAKISLPSLEEFWFPGADDTRVHGFLQKPPGFDPGKKYPAVLVIHGGPQGMWADRFMTTWFTFPLFSSPGYVGVFINPRGSSGYGLEFQTQVSRDYGGRCYEDLMKGLDYAIEHHEFIDPTRLAAVGGSFGGYSVNWIIGQTDRFRCAVSHAGLFNLTSFYGATEELWFPAWDMGETPWDEPELYARWSPHHHVKRFKTPTLVTHGELDYRVPFAESLQLFTALQRRKVPSRLVVFPDDGHVIERPQNNVRWWKEIHRWLKQWLE